MKVLRAIDQVLKRLWAIMAVRIVADVVANVYLILLGAGLTLGIYVAMRRSEITYGAGDLNFYIFPFAFAFVWQMAFYFDKLLIGLLKRIRPAKKQVEPLPKADEP